MATPILLDDFDHRLLALLQDDAARTLTALGEAVGLSPSAVQRRLTRYRRHGLLQQVAVLNPEAFPATTRVEVLYRLATAQFRLAEQQNCVAHHNAASCIFPLSAEAVHVDPEGARAGLATLEELLALEPQRREAQWMLNLAHMALGTWPDGVPQTRIYGEE